MAARVGRRRPAGWRGERGAELVEFALVLPLLLVIVMGIIDFGLMFQRYLVITNAAREGARIALLPGYTDDDVEARVNEYAAAGGLPSNPATDVTDDTETLPSGNTISIVRVTVTYPHDFGFVSGLISMVGGTSGPVTLTAEAVMRREIAAGGGE